MGLDFRKCLKQILWILDIFRKYSHFTEESSDKQKYVKAVILWHLSFIYLGWDRCCRVPATCYMFYVITLSDHLCFSLVMTEPGEWGGWWRGWRGREDSCAGRWQDQEQQTWITRYNSLLLQLKIHTFHYWVGSKNWKTNVISYRCNSFPENWPRENSCQILHFGHQGCYQVLTFIQKDQCSFMWSVERIRVG